MSNKVFLSTWLRKRAVSESLLMSKNLNTFLLLRQ